MKTTRQRVEEAIDKLVEPSRSQVREAVGKREFIGIASIVREMKHRHGAEAAEDLVRMLASYFQNRNPRFDEERFREACGM